MRIFRTKDYEDMSRQAANLLGAQVLLKPDAVLGLATGSSPLGAYRLLRERCEKGELDFSRARAINLDEYCGLGPQHPQSYRYFMQQNLFDHINIPPENTHLPHGLAPDPAAECARYDAVIAGAGGIDMQLLGLGLNGHIGFNEPADTFAGGTHRVALTQSTIQANSRFFGEEEVPRYAYTMGISSIMQARRILVIVSGESKAQILREAFAGPVTPLVPASVLQLHRDVILVGDAPALSLLC